MRTSALILCLGLVFIVGCTTSPAKVRVAAVVPGLSLDHVTVCSGYTCHNKNIIKISADEWATIEALFAPAPLSAEEERNRVSIAVGLFETLTGAKAGTLNDKPESPLLLKTTGQLDCVDEAFNTSIFLNLLAQNNLLVFHTVKAPEQRGHFIGGWPHSTAVLNEPESGVNYAIDSWFYKSGVSAEVLTLALWKSGWKPGKDREAP